MAIDKVEYTPSQTKRFEVSQDEYSRTRLKFLGDMTQNICEITPFEVGVSVIGSLSKGKTLDKKTEGATDVDAIIYLDSDSVVEHFEDERTPVEVRDAYYFQIGKWDKLSSLKGNPNLSINSSHIPDDPSKMVKAAQGYVQHNIPTFMDNTNKANKKWSYFDQDIFVVPIAIKGENSILDMVEKYEKALEAHDEHGMERAVVIFSYVFGLDLGGHLKKYRQAFIKELQQKDPAEAEKLWGFVRDGVKRRERRNDIPENLESQFPATLEQASAYYIPLHKPTVS